MHANTDLLGVLHLIVSKDVLVSKLSYAASPGEGLIKGVVF